MAETFSIQAVLSAVDRGFTSSMEKAEGSADGLDKNMKKTNTSILDIAKGVGVFKLVDVGVNAITNSLGSAISRFDTLNQYPKVLESLGASAEESDRGIQILSDGIDGLPTKLDDVAATSQQMFLVFRDADKASESTIALNNALLASGADSQKAAQGTEAYLKMLRSGKVDMQTWQSLQNSMGIGLDKVAKQMLGAGASTNDLYKELQSGKISVDDFNGALVDMSDELGELARTNTKGIGTSFKNMANAVGKGVANVIKALNEFVIAAGINAEGIMGIFDDLKNAINTSFTMIIKSIESVTPYFAAMFQAIGTLTPAIPLLTIAVIGLSTAFMTMKVVNSVTSWLNKMNSSVGAAKLAMNMYATATNSGAKSTVAFEAVQKITNGSMKISAMIFGAATGQIKIMTAAKMVLTTVSKGLYAALGPIGIAMGAIAAVGATLAWVYKKNTAETKAFKEAQEEMTESIKDSAEAYDRNIEKVTSQRESTNRLKDEIVGLAIEENKSIEQKELLKSKIDELNGKVEGLGLAYIEEADGINMSSEQLEKRIDLQDKVAMGNLAEEQLVELQIKRAASTKAVAEAEEQVQEMQDKGLAYGKNYRNMVKGLDEAKLNSEEIAKQIDSAEITREEGAKSRIEQMKQARTTMVEQGKIDYEGLSDSQKSAFGSMQKEYDSLRNSATDAFKEISQTTDVTVGSMITTLEKNQEATLNWKANLDNLYSRAAGSFDTEFLEKLESEGIDKNAGVMQMLANSTDEELQRLSALFKQNGELSTDVYGHALGEGGPKIAEGLSKSFEEANRSTKKLATDSGLAQLGKDIMGTITKDIENSSAAVEKAVEKAVEPTKKLPDLMETSGVNTVGGLAKGIQIETPKAEKQAELLAEATDNGFTNFLDIHSPSRKMIENGEFVVAGLIKGLESKGDLPVESMQNIAAGMLNSIEHLPGELENIGFNAMMGFNNGLQTAGNTALTTANKIANDVANTMRKALDIHSPSRVMREIGGFVGEGLALGMKESEKLVSKVSESLAASFIEPQTSLSSGYSSSFNNGSAMTVVEVVTNLDGQEMARTMVDPLSKELQNLQNKKNISFGRGR